jgi:hypothetical protein
LLRFQYKNSLIENILYDALGVDRTPQGKIVSQLSLSRFCLCGHAIISTCNLGENSFFAKTLKRLALKYLSV